ncbi:glycosyl transferase [Francisella tularensis subsp. holarctica PHIT-FT049]|uniref:glycosyltransferase family 2 protein n=1 Tax=Francisella tularensis TaxID=263 RepID=UPI0003E7746B|nr:glycosyl transferase [Francisella tularensis subsp. holarctica PHIT-FT049]ALK93666.1 glycosyl transferase [Francisella tularensis]
MKYCELITLVIPIYNIENYLGRCLDSVINQTYKDLEIILVNDGSTDNSLEICESYAKEDSRIKIINKNNGGLSSARNVGLDACKGDYVTFIDSDDWVSLDYIEILYKNIIDNNADISIINAIKVKSQNNDFTLKEQKNLLHTYFSSIEFALDNTLPVMACAKLYKTKLFENLRFTNSIVFEDEDIMYRLLYHANKIVCTDYIGYFYFQRPTSITSSKKKRQNIIKSSDSLIFVLTKKEQFFKGKTTIPYKFYIDSAGLLSRYYAKSFLYPFDKEMIKQRKKIKLFINKLLQNTKSIETFRYKIKRNFIKYFVFFFLFKD